MTFKCIWNLHINLHIRFNWDLNLTEVSATQSFFALFDIKSDIYTISFCKFLTEHFTLDIYV